MSIDLLTSTADTPNDVGRPRWFRFEIIGGQAGQGPEPSLGGGVVMAPSAAAAQRYAETMLAGRGRVRMVGAASATTTGIPSVVHAPGSPA